VNGTGVVAGVGIPNVIWFKGGIPLTAGAGPGAGVPDGVGVLEDMAAGEVDMTAEGTANVIDDDAAKATTGDKDEVTVLGAAPAGMTWRLWASRAFKLMFGWSCAFVTANKVKRKATA
jgi:hypothetical protein